MRAGSLVPALLTAALIAAACGDGGPYGGRSPTATRSAVLSPTAVRNVAPPTPTSAPEPTPTSAPTLAPTEARTVAPTRPPEAPPSPTSPPSAPRAASLTVTARNVRFEQTELTVDAGAQVTLTFDNQDSVSHNIDIVGVAKTDVFAGPGQRTITFTAPSPGTYAYRCDVHPGAMQGTLTVR